MTMAREIKSRMSSVQSGPPRNAPGNDIINTRGKPVQSSGGCC